MKKRLNVPRSARSGPQRDSNGGIPWQILLSLILALQFACSADEKSAPSGSPPGMPPLDSAEQRIVSLSPLATHFVTELGAGRLLVGVDAESSALPALADLPVVDLDSAHNLAPDIVLIPDLVAADDAAVRSLDLVGARLVEFAPHDFEDVFALCRGLGAHLVGVASATLFERRIARPLAIIGGISPPLGRVRVVAVVGLEPLELAGGHSFQTDLIEIAGGTSVTHGGEESRIAMTPERWNEFSPDLVLVSTSVELSLARREVARSLIPDRFRVEFFAFDPETFWLREPEREAERLRVLIASYSRDTSS
jgi:ABC-type hemin transport system substrate-binding protein